MYPLKRAKTETAQDVMVTGVPCVAASSSVGEVLDNLQSKAHKYETFNYVYVVGDQDKLIGVTSLKKLFSSDNGLSVSELMQSDLITVKTNDDQEHVAQLALRHQLKAIPVIDKQGKLQGVVPPHAILQILHLEHEEDVLAEAGIAYGGIKSRLMSQVNQRLPWLVLGTFGGIAAAIVVGMFEEALAEEVLLAAFIPTVVYLADAVGVQVQTIYIRYTALGKLPNIKRYLSKEILISLIVATTLGLVAASLVWLWFDAGHLALIVGISTSVSIVFASIVAVVLPWTFQKLNLDPAVASGPFATIIRDVAAIVIYFVIAQYFLGVML